MPQLTTENSAEIEISKTAKRDADSPSAFKVVNKRQKTDSPETISPHEGKESNYKKGSATTKKVDPTELASAFALASLASLSPTSTESSLHHGAKPEDAKYKLKQDHEKDSLKSSSSWEETRSPKAEQHHISPEQRSPGSIAGSQDTSSLSMDERTPGGNRKVTFAPNTKETASPSTPLRSRIAASRRLAMPQHRPNPSPSSDGMMVSPRPHRMVGGMHPYMRTPPHLTYSGSFLHHGMPPPPPPPHHHSPYHQLHLPHGPFGHPFPHHRPSPGAHWQYPGQPGVARLGFPPQQVPRHLLQPALLHSSGGENNEQDGPTQWICDFCNVASFDTYEEACIHEERCKMRGHSTPSGGDASLVSLSRSRSASCEEDAEGVVTVPPTSVHQQEWYRGTLSLSIEESDREWLSELNCYIRSRCVEAFSATEGDVTKSTKRGRITLDQVGIRCCFCSHSESKEADSEEEAPSSTSNAVAAVSFPSSILGIYESVKRWQRVHLEVCDKVPEEVRDQLSTLANDNVWVPTTRQYWADSARALGLADTNEGIRFGKDPNAVREEVKRIIKAPSGEESEHRMEQLYHRHQFLQHQFHQGRVPPSPPMPSRMGHLHHAIRLAGDHPSMHFSSQPYQDQHHLRPHFVPSTATQLNSLGGYIVFPQDMEMIPPYVYFLMRQVEPCLFTEADRFVARSKGPVGYPGFQCRHCNGHAGLGKYFPVSSKSLSTNSTSQNIHAHLLKCRKCPDMIKDRLVQLKIEKSRAPRLEPGWRKVFFDKVWGRLHHNSDIKRSTIVSENRNEDNDNSMKVEEEKEEDNHAGSMKMEEENEVSGGKELSDLQEEDKKLKQSTT